MAVPFVDDERWFTIYPAPDRSAEPVPAFFVDRDGVVIVEKHYLGHPSGVDLCAGTADALLRLRQRGVPIVLVTNQAGIGRGIYSWSDYAAVHQRMLDLIGDERCFAAAYANSHVGSEGNASWRKPNPGMLLQAAADLNLCLDKSVMVGDKLVDLQAAANAGVGHLVHVLTGHGAAERSKVVDQFPHAVLCDSLADVDFGSFPDSCE